MQPTYNIYCLLMQYIHNTDYINVYNKVHSCENSAYTVNLNSSYDILYYIGLVISYYLILSQGRY